MSRHVHKGSRLIVSFPDPTLEEGKAKGLRAIPWFCNLLAGQFRILNYRTTANQIRGMWFFSLARHTPQSKERGVWCARLVVFHVTLAGAIPGNFSLVPRPQSPRWAEEKKGLASPSDGLETRAPPHYQVHISVFAIIVKN